MCRLKQAEGFTRLIEDTLTYEELAHNWLCQVGLITIYSDCETKILLQNTNYDLETETRLPLVKSFKAANLLFVLSSFRLHDVAPNLNYFR